MPPKLSRDAIVNALDDLGEREKLAEAWTKDADPPYPNEAARNRSKRLRWGLRWRRAGFFVLMLLVGLTGGLGITGWTIPGALSGFLLGFGGMFIVVSLFKDPWAEDHVRALQLYDLLKQLDNPSNAVSESSTVEAA
jgi:hypothetical protein